MHIRSALIGFRRNGSPIWKISGGNGAGDGGSSSGSGDGGGSGSGDDGGSGQSSGDGGAGGDGGGSQSGQSGGDGGQGDRGFPESTPVAEMTTEQQAAYWKFHSRKHEERANARSDYDDLKAKADKLDEIEAANATEAERAAKAAREEGKSEGLREAASVGVDTHIEAAVTAGRLTKEQADALLEGIDRTKFLTAEHRVDTDKVKALLDNIAPATGNGSGTGVDYGQGRRGSGTKVSGKEAGLEEARKRFGDRAAAK